MLSKVLNVALVLAAMTANASILVDSAAQKGIACGYCTKYEVSSVVKGKYYECDGDTTVAATFHSGCAADCSTGCSESITMSSTAYLEVDGEYQKLVSTETCAYFITTTEWSASGCSGGAGTITAQSSIVPWCLSSTSNFIGQICQDATGYFEITEGAARATTPTSCPSSGLATGTDGATVQSNTCTQNSSGDTTRYSLTTCEAVGSNTCMRIAFSASDPDLAALLKEAEIGLVCTKCNIYTNDASTLAGRYLECDTTASPITTTVHEGCDTSCTKTSCSSSTEVFTTNYTSVDEGYFKIVEAESCNFLVQEIVYPDSACSETATATKFSPPYCKDLTAAHDAELCEEVGAAMVKVTLSAASSLTACQRAAAYSTGTSTVATTTCVSTVEDSVTTYSKFSCIAAGDNSCLSALSSDTDPSGDTDTTTSGVASLCATLVMAVLALIAL